MDWRTFCVVWVVLALAIAGCEGTEVADPEPVAVDCEAVISLQAGDIAGEDYNNACVYRAIPFAAPPVGDLAFAAPQPAVAWNGVRQPNNWGNDCLQSDNPLSLNGSDQDCLFLHVWTPGSSQSGTLQDLPVMVFYHGGGFGQGAGAHFLYWGDTLVGQDEDPVIVVTVNYRMGTFGYLASTGVADAIDADSVGNMGLKDQRFALDWVQQEIAKFGGDPDRVTIFGESAGAFSVCSLLASEGIQDVIAGAIMQSGMCVVGSYKSSTELADEYLVKRGCPVTSAAHECLQDYAPRDLTPGANLGMYSGAHPVVDGVMLKDQPVNQLRAGHAKGIPFMAGFNREELKIASLAPDFLAYRNKDFGEFYVELEDYFTLAEIARLQEIYPPEEYENPLALWLDVVNDQVFGCGAHHGMVAHQSHGPAWMYRFSFGTDAFAIEPYVGTPHGGELPFVFGTFDVLGILYAGDRDLSTAASEHSRRVQRYWRRFAHYGNPNGPEDHSQDPYWPQFGTDHNILELTPEPTVSVGSHTDRCAFWADWLPLDFHQRLEAITAIVEEASASGDIPGF